VHDGAPRPPAPRPGDHGARLSPDQCPASSRRPRPS
jgi:hypothetical protein